MSIAMVTLKDGTQVPESVCILVMKSLNVLLEQNFTAFYDLVMLARGRDYRVSEGNANAIRNLALLENDGRPHEDVRAIVRNAVEGEGWQMVLGSPVKE